MKNKGFLVVLAVFVLFAGVLPLEAQSRRWPNGHQSRSQAYHSRPSVRVYNSYPYRSYRVRSYYGFGVGYGYRSYGYSGRYYMPATGIRFHLELVPKSDQEMVKRGIVTVDGAEQGITNRFDSWQNGHIPVDAGEHNVLVELEDGRVFQTTVAVQLGQVLHVYLRFPKP